MRKEKRKSLGAVTHTHTHKTFTKETESKPILWWNPSTRQRERESRNFKRESSRRLKVLNLNLSATMVVAVIIAIIIIAIIAVKMIVTAINSSSQKAMAEEETKGYTMVDSTEIGEDGKPLQVPVPEGFSASQVPGETTVSGGFVIYEGDVDWSKIEDLDSYAEVEATAEKVETQAEDASTENNNADATSNNSSSTVNEDNSEEVVQEEQSQEENSDQADSPENSQENSPENSQEDVQENVISEEKEMTQEQKDAENVQVQEEEMKDTEQIDNIEENPEEIEQGNNEVINEEEITDEEAGVATMSEEENEEIETMSEEDAGIATLAEGETPTTVFDLQKSRNQYVWVPVKDVSRIYGVDSNGKLWGKLYNYSNSSTVTSRSPYWSESNGVMNKPSSSDYREPDVVHNRTGYDADSKVQGYRDGIEQYQMLSQEMEENFYKMIESVKKYGGFYIGRYETGDLNQEEAVVQKMNNNLGSVNWYVMYEKCKNLAGTNENVETSMIWGSMWDETMEWLIESEAEITTGEKMTYDLVAKNSTKWGNYSNATFEYKTTSGGINTKTESWGQRIPTGSTEYTKANNIYDLAGNVYEWTLEVYATYNRVLRGGRYDLTGSESPVGNRLANAPIALRQQIWLSSSTLHKIESAYPEPLYPDTQVRTGSKVCHILSLVQS